MYCNNNCRRLEHKSRDVVMPQIEQLNCDYADYVVPTLNNINSTTKYKPGQSSAGDHIVFNSRFSLLDFDCIFWLWDVVLVPSKHIFPFPSSVVW